MAELLTGGDPTRFFQVGQQIAGESGLGTFVKDLTERAKQFDLLNVQSQFKTQQAVNEAHALLPAKKEEVLQEQGIKSDLAEQRMKGIFDRVQGSQGSQGNFPPGSTLNTNLSTGETSIHQELNPKFTGDSATIISSVTTLRPEVQKLRSMIESGEVGQRELLAAQNIPGGQTGIFLSKKATGLFSKPGENDEYFRKVGEVRGSMDRVRFGSFSFGGKQLTPYEAKVLNSLAEPAGKDPGVAVQDLQFLEDILNRMEAAEKGGRAGFTSVSDIINEARSGGGSGSSAQPQTEGIVWD